MQNWFVCYWCGAYYYSGRPSKQYPNKVCKPLQWIQHFVCHMRIHTISKMWVTLRPGTSWWFSSAGLRHTHVGQMICGRLWYFMIFPWHFHSSSITSSIWLIFQWCFFSFQWHVSDSPCFNDMSIMFLCFPMILGKFFISYCTRQKAHVSKIYVVFSAVSNKGRGFPYRDRMANEAEVRDGPVSITCKFRCGKCKRFTKMVGFPGLC